MAKSVREPWNNSSATDLSWDNECNRLHSAARKLVRTRNFALGDIKRTTRQEAHAALRVRRLVLSEGVKSVGLVLIVTNVAVTLACKEEEVVVAPKRHEHAGALVDQRHLDIAEAASFPDADLAVAHLAESGRRDAVVLAHPRYACTLW